MDAERPHTPFAIRAIWWIIYATFLTPFIVFLLYFLVLALFEISNYSRLREMNAAYEKTAVGDSWISVEETFGQPPSHTCRFASFEIHYYIDPTRYSMSPDAAYMYTLTERAANKDEIPFSKGAKQYLVKDGDVIARIWIGEESYVETIEGRIEANSIRDLPDEFFERHSD